MEKWYCRLRVSVTWGMRAFGIAGALLVLALAAPALAQTTRYVAPGGTDGANTCDDSFSPCATLQHAIEQSAAGDVVSLAAGTFMSTMAVVDRNLTIQGQDAASTIISADWKGTVITVQAGVTATIEKLTITRGEADYGGGILNNGTVTVNEVILTRNMSWELGGSIMNYGTMTVLRSRIEDNFATGAGGGISSNGFLMVIESEIIGNSAGAGAGEGDGAGIDNSGTLEILRSTIIVNENGGLSTSGNTVITHSTIVGNYGHRAAGISARGKVEILYSSIIGNRGRGGALRGGPFYVSGSILYGNSGELAEWCYEYATTIVSRGYNVIQKIPKGCSYSGATSTDIVGVDPLLGSLAYNGGPTLNALPDEASPAIDLVPLGVHGCGTTDTDQRGMLRGQDGDLNGTGACDAGSVEIEPPAAPACPATLHIDAFDADQGVSDTQEWVRITHDEAAPFDFAGCHLAAILGKTDRSTFTVPLAGVVPPGEALLVGNAAVPGVDVVIPDNTLHDRSSGIYVLSAPMPPGARPYQWAHRIRAGVTYYDEANWYSQYPAPAGAKQAAGVEVLLEGLTAVASEAAAAGEVPAAYALEAAYPNPFNPATTIRFDLPEAVAVELVVFDVLGREVARLVDGPLGAGRHLVRFEASGLPSGVYLYRLQAGAFTQTRSMMLAK